MSYVVYENDITGKARLHYEDCKKARQGGKNGNGSHRYFENYDDAWDYMSNCGCSNYGDCKHCNPDDD